MRIAPIAATVFAAILGAVVYCGLNDSHDDQNPGSAPDPVTRIVIPPVNINNIYH